MRDARRRLTAALTRQPGASPSELARALDVHPKTVQRALNVGRREGWIDGGRGSTRRIFLTLDAWLPERQRPARPAAPKAPQAPLAPTRSRAMPRPAPTGGRVGAAPASDGSELAALLDATLALVTNSPSSLVRRSMPSSQARPSNPGRELEPSEPSSVGAAYYPGDPLDALWGALRGETELAP
jgi:hypothetical protein